MNLSKKVKHTLLSTVTIGAAICLIFSGCSNSIGSNGGQKNQPKITLGTPFAHPTNVEVIGLSNQQILSSTGSQARWAYLPGEHPFNTKLDDIVSGYLEAQAQSRGEKYKPEAHDISAHLVNRGCVSGSTALTAQEILDDPTLSAPTTAETQLTITCEPVLAMGTIFAERLRFVRGNTTEIVSDAIEILYTDTETEDTARGRELFTETALHVLYDSLFELLKLDLPMSGNKVILPSNETLSNLQSSLSNVGFNENGDAVVTVDLPFVAAISTSDPDYTAKPTTLVIPAERAEDLLTPLGQSISATKSSQPPWDGPAPVPSGQEHVNCGLVPCVAVTYDDGPCDLTSDVLDTYAERDHAATTFFVLGQNVEGHEETLKRAVQEGHQIGNHSYDHPPLTTLTDEQIRDQIEQTTALITGTTGQEVTVVRPPYGDLNERTLAVTALPSILWSIDTNDWQQPGAEAILEEAVKNAEPDDIILMHDIHETTVSVATDVADGLLNRGFTLTTISQLFDGIEMGPHAYTSAKESR